MRRHVIRYHIASEGWWFLFPLLTCWNCRRWVIALHVDLHGPFDEDHIPELATRLEGFVRYVCSGLGLASTSDELVNFVVQRQLGDEVSAFNPEETCVWDAYDKFISDCPRCKNAIYSSPRASPRCYTGGLYSGY